MSDHYESTRDMVRRVCAEADRLAAELADWQVEYEQKLIQRSGPREDLIYKTRELIEAPPEQAPQPVSDVVTQDMLGDAVEIVGEETYKLHDALEKKISDLADQVARLTALVEGNVKPIRGNAGAA